MVERVEDCVDDLDQVVRGDVGGHTDRDAGRTIDEEVGEPSRHHHRFVTLPRVVWGPVHRVFADALQQVGSEWSHPRLGIPHRSRRVINGAEVPLRIDERVAHREVLAEPDHGVIHRFRRVWVVPTDDVTYHARRLAVRSAGSDTRVMHRIQDSAMHRLQPIAHIGKRPGHDHRHRVLEERVLHFACDVDLRNLWSIGHHRL